MKHRPTLTRKQLTTFCLSFVSLTFIILGFLSHDSVSRQFQSANEQLFYEEMTSNTLNMHYTIAVPENYGIKDYEVILPGYNRENRKESLTALKKQLDFYKGLDSSKLSKEDAYTLSLLLSYLENSYELGQYPYYNEPLASSSGIQSQLPILLAEYTFRSKRDVEDYLKLLDQTDEYFASLLTFEQEKAAEGLFMAASSADQVIEQCDTILTKEALEEGTHFLQTTFAERLQELLEQKLITEKEMDSYLHQNDRLLSTVLLPAYQNLGDGLLVLQDESIPLSGLASKPEGKDYYELLLISETGSYRPIEDIKQLLVTQLEQEFATLSSLLSQYSEPTFSALQKSMEENFSLTNAADMLKHLTQCMSTDFPSAASPDGTHPQVRVKNVSKSLEEYCAPAFYLTPPLDDTNSNVIYINQKNSPTGLDLYTTLAHEGYPGHMYQSVYSNNLLSKQESGTVRQLLWYGGYLEGWALYVEFLSYDYASQMMEDQNLSAQAEYIQIEKHNRSLQLCLYSLLDIMIHYEDASYSQIHKTLANFGITSPESTSAIYAYIVEEPANYLKYYLGYLEILSLQKEAQTLWGSAYSDYAFHEFFLSNGPADFKTLSSCLQSTGNQ